MSMELQDVVIVAAARTPFGKFGGVLSPLSAVDLGAIAVREAISRIGLDPAGIDQVILGNVLPDGLGQIPARQVALKAGIPAQVPSLAINKVCGSSLKACSLAATLIKYGEAETIVAGGMESMSNAPYLLDKARWGYRMGNGELRDSMIVDGLWCPINGVHMGIYGSSGAKDHEISRQQQDEFAARSQQRFAAAQLAGKFDEEIVATEVPQGKGKSMTVRADEPPRPDTTVERLAALKPAFEASGTVTAGNAPGVNDGAAALVLMSASRAAQIGAKPLARILASGEAAMEPHHMNAVPAQAITNALKKAGLTLRDIELVEINEAFAAVPLVCATILGLDLEKVNVNGGAVAVGHPIGASGGRILMTLVYEMRRRGARYGLAGICSGTAQGDAIVVEAL
ncbi:MAG: acetyl-CoA acetyltransferase [Chloroflexi bacterium]|nr:acetyl-CoA acetyltransferase [Chloroflexota bacterium]